MSTTESKFSTARASSSPTSWEGKIEEILLNDIAVPLKTGGEIGRVIYADEKESQDYIDHLVSTIGSELAGLHILVDCANGAASATAARLLFGPTLPDLHTDVIHADPDGVNINNGCGSTHLDQLKAMVEGGRVSMFRASPLYGRRGPLPDGEAREKDKICRCIY